VSEKEALRVAFELLSERIDNWGNALATEEFDRLCSARVVIEEIIWKKD
jgi:hypothetical protein